MKFAFIYKGNYSIGDVIKVHGEKMIVEEFAPSGKNLYAVTPKGAPKFKRVLCCCSLEKPIEAILS